VIFTFGTFEFDDQNNELRKNGRAVAIEPQPAKALALLLTRSGEVVSREELRDAVWGRDTHVDFDRGLAYCISQVRSALGDSGENPRFVQTIPRRGFKFIAPLARATPETPVLHGGPIAPVLQAPSPFPPMPPKGTLPVGLAFLGALVATVAALFVFNRPNPIVPLVQPVFIGVSIFDNETGLAEHDRLVAGLSDLVVERLSKIDPERIAVIGNANSLRQPRNIRNLDAIPKNLGLQYVLLGQLQQSESGLRFITHFIRMSDQAHLKANRLAMPDGAVSGLESLVVAEFETAVRRHVLNQTFN
jgi:DNA-binding winged helix-turn-helix (wHTH) protein/TolB-like protein